MSVRMMSDVSVQMNQEMNRRIFQRCTYRNYASYGYVVAISWLFLDKEENQNRLALFLKYVKIVLEVAECLLRKLLYYGI